MTVALFLSSPSRKKNLESSVKSVLGKILSLIFQSKYQYDVVSKIYFQRILRFFLECDDRKMVLISVKNLISCEAIYFNHDVVKQICQTVICESRLGDYVDEN